MKHTFAKCMSLALLWVMAASAWAIHKVDGIYQIGTAEDLAEFISLVNAGEKNANAVLTADIDYSAGTEVIQYFTGTLDGQHHTITVGWNNQPHNFNALIYKHYGRVINLCTGYNRCEPEARIGPHAHLWRLHRSVRLESQHCFQRKWRCNTRRSRCRDSHWCIDGKLRILWFYHRRQLHQLWRYCRMGGSELCHP